MARQFVIFIHIHKCGGSSLSSVIRRNLCHPPEQLTPADGIASLKPQRLVESILRTARRDGYVMGHLGYGTHLIFASPCRYFTMLREPQSRLISLWRHAVVTPNAYYHKAARDLSFPAFLAQRRPLELDNGLVRFLSGDPAGENVFINPRPFGTLDQSDLQRALTNLEHGLEGFGLVEQFDKSLLLMKAQLGLRHCFYERRNEASPAVPKPSFPDEARPLVSLDQVLYSAALRIWQERIASQPASFESSLVQFQTVNRALQPAFWLRQGLKKGLSALRIPQPQR